MGHRGMLLTSAAVCLAALLPPSTVAGTAQAAARGASPASPAPPHSSVHTHLTHLHEIAQRHGGHRASGSAGHRESLEYAERVLRSAGYRTQRQPFRFLYTETLAQRLTLADGTPRTVVLAGYSPSTPPGGMATTLAVPGGAGGGLGRLGCTPDDYADTPVAGRTVLLANGGCTLDDKQRVAADAGAVAVLVANDGPGELHGWLTRPRQARIPVGGVSRATGRTLAAEAARGRPVTLELRSLTEERVTANLLATSPAGDPAHTVVAGAHLDSVPTAPGVNDNGVAVAVLLDTAVRLAETAREPRNRLVFALWGAEEFGMLGSQHYVRTLPPAQRDRTELYLNLEMVGSPNYGLFVLDGKAPDEQTGTVPPPGSAEITRRLRDAVSAQGHTARLSRAEARSDYAPFMAAGVPVGSQYGGSFERKTAEEAALWGGTAGAPYDACYHLACDDIDNYSPVAAEIHRRAFATVLGHYARHRLTTQGTS